MGLQLVISQKGRRSVSASNNAPRMGTPAPTAGRLALAGLWPERGANVAAGIKTHTGGRLILKSQMEVDNE